MQPNSSNASAPVASDELAGISERVRSLLRRSVEDIIEIGRSLQRAKELLPHGNFGAWLDKEFGLSERSAQNFMNAAKRFGDRSEMIADLKPGALYLLAAPSTHQGVIDQVLNGELGRSLKEIDAAVQAGRRRNASAPQRTTSRHEPTGQIDKWPQFLTRLEGVLLELSCDFGLDDPDGLSEATCRALDRKRAEALVQSLPTLHALIDVLNRVAERCSATTADFAVAR
jgi:hypothetical protein